MADTTENRAKTAAGDRAGLIRVLIVDDERLVRWSIANALEKAGCATEVVESGEKAIEKLYSGMFDVVITDLNLPRIDGLHVAAAAKAFSPAVRVVLMSAREEEIPSSGREKGDVDAFLEKPFDLRELTDLVARLSGKAMGHLTHHG